MKKLEYIKAQKETLRILKQSNIIIPKNAEIEVVDFGLGNYKKVGLNLYIKVNEPEYCSKWLVLLPGQTCPFHKHKNKKETFIVMQGSVDLTVENKQITLKRGDSFTMKQNTYHTFTSKKGAVIEEVSTYDSNADNYFKDERIMRDTVIE